MSGGLFGWDYPPGVTGREPAISGEYPCEECGGDGYDVDEDGKHACPNCQGSGIEPEPDEVEYDGPPEDADEV